MRRVLRLEAAPRMAGMVVVEVLWLRNLVSRLYITVAFLRGGVVVVLNGEKKNWCAVRCGAEVEKNLVERFRCRSWERDGQDLQDNPQFSTE
jgi:hypothetical protein